MEIPALEPGNYLLEITTDNDKIAPEYHLYDVTTLTLVQQDLPDRKTRYAVVNTITGHPVKGAKVVLYYNPTSKKGHKETVACDENGEAVVQMPNDDTPDYVWAYNSDDRYMPLSSRGWGRDFSYRAPEKRPEENVSIYTDRAIYRPGQTVHVSLVAFSTTEGWTTQVLPGREMQLTLLDANWKEVKTVELTTDDFGNAEADFVLPSNGLTGRFTLRTNSPRNAQSFRVEEYKRPTFEVTFDEYKERYEAGQDIQVTGHARSYAGVPVQGAKVKYTVRREMAYWYWWRERGRGEELTSGETVTDENGDFKVDMPLRLPHGDGYYLIIAEAEVTDISGESHEGTTSLPLGSKPTAFFCNIPELRKGYGMQLRKPELDPFVWDNYNSQLFQLGAQVKMNLKASLNDVFTYETQLILFTDYLNHPFVWNRINWDNKFGLNVGKYVKVAFDTWTIYDPIVIIANSKGENPTQRVQFKEFFSINFTYTLGQK